MSDSTPTTPVCVHCGTARPADEPTCPTCGKPWIDGAIPKPASTTDQPQPSTDTDGAPVVVPPVVPPGSSSPEPTADTGQDQADDANKDEASVADETSVVVPPVVPPGSSSPEPTADTGQDEADDANTDEASSPNETSPPPPVVPPVAASVIPPPPIDDTGEFDFDQWTLPPEKTKSRARWLIPILLLVAVIVVWVLVFLDQSPSTPVVVVASSTTSTTRGAEATTTTDSGTTTTAAETSTTIPYPPPSDWPPVGDPIDTADLTLMAAGIGPLDFQMTIGDAAGALTSSLGEAEGSGIDGLCPPDEAYWLQWGELKAIFSGFDPGSNFVSYRYEDVGSTTELGLKTLSGLELGDTVAELQAIYASYTVSFELIDGVDHFRLLDGGDLLLWGPVTSTEPDGIVNGIYSPSPCT